ncbi:MAG: amino acid ABC transporter ATP-binding protein [Candidatus Borkfalkiaceae bacterium]|nr:amino acid ABC transporter ATP-binding protein [Christensenellaceae bacterium]
MAYFEVKNIRKAFDKTEVLKGVSFAMRKGEVLSVIGSSGGGKTTLLRCIDFLERADEGQIVLDGDVLFDASEGKKKDVREKRLGLGLVFQNFNLFPQYTVKENVMLAPKLRLKEKSRKEKTGKAWYQAALAELEGKAEEVLFRVGLTAKKDRYPSELSGGQQQRVAIARALALSPKILCFDEPTSALDPELTGEVLKVIGELRGSDMTMIIVTHEMEFCRRVSDHVLFLHDGRVEEYGDPEEVFDRPKSEYTKAFLKNYKESATGGVL